MNSLTREQFSTLLKVQRVKSRLVRDLRFAPEDINSWEDLDLLAIATRSGSEGLLLLQTSNFYLITYALTTGLRDKTTGRAKPITCDFCFTWQQGGNAASITFTRATDNHNFTYLCCADLKCSLHVRDLTPEAKLSRTQLREDITTPQRIIRLKRKISAIIQTLELNPVALEQLRIIANA